MQPQRRHADELHDEVRVTEALRENEWCHAPHKDIVVPTFWPALPTARGVQNSRHPLTHPADRPSKQLLFFAGDVRIGEPSYSGGMRQAIAQLPGAAVSGQPIRVVRGRSSDDSFRQSKFCLAVSGNGWGNRWQKSFLHNCVPVVAAPRVVQPFEATLANLSDVSLRVSDAEVPSMAEMLDAVPTGDERRMAPCRTWSLSLKSTM